jgi:DNA-binding MarR family transcriptional regulator
MNQDANTSEVALSSRFDSLEQQAYLNLWRTYDRLRGLEDELFNRYGLTAQQYNTLRILAARNPDPLPTLTIATKLISRAPDITRLLDRLAERNLITRKRPSGNRRTVLVSITQAGLDLLAELAEQVRECHRRQLGHLSAEQLHQLIDLLSQARRPHEDATSTWR